MSEDEEILSLTNELKIIDNDIKTLTLKIKEGSKVEVELELDNDIKLEIKMEIRKIKLHLKKQRKEIMRKFKVVNEWR